MKRRLLTIGLPLLGCLACGWLASQVLMAQPPGDITGVIVEVKHADLVVTQIDYHGFVGVPDPDPWFTVKVKNIGNVASEPCRVDFAFSTNLVDPLMHVSYDTLPALAPGEARNTPYGFEPVPEDVQQHPLKGMIIAVVDAPVKDKPYGQVAESSGELNNVFGLTFQITTEPGTLSHPNPITWKNPAVQ